jgi:hypothetical protein
MGKWWESLNTTSQKFAQIINLILMLPATALFFVLLGYGWNAHENIIAVGAMAFPFYLWILGKVTGTNLDEKIISWMFRTFIGTLVFLVIIAVSGFMLFRMYASQEEIVRIEALTATAIHNQHATETARPTQTYTPSVTSIASATPTTTVTVTASAEVTDTPGSPFPMAQAAYNVNVYVGPSLTQYPRLTILERGGEVRVTGLSDDGEWYQVWIDSQYGWIPKYEVAFIGNDDSLPIRRPPTDTPTPTDLPSATPTVTASTTPTATATPTATTTPSNTPTTTATRTPTATPTHTPSNTPTATVTPTATRTPSATPTRTPTATATLTLCERANVDGNTRVNDLDIQLIDNAAKTGSNDPRYDIDQNGRVNQMDVREAEKCKSN